MCIYDHLFFHAYRIMSHPKNTFNDIPVFASLILVCPCVMFNVATVMFLLSYLGIWPSSWIFPKELKYPITIFFMLALYFFYKQNDYYKKILFNKKLESVGILKSILVVLLYLGVSLMLLYISIHI